MTIKLVYGTQSGEVNDSYIALYSRRAQGETALLTTTKPLFIEENGREFPPNLESMITQFTPT